MGVNVVGASIEKLCVLAMFLTSESATAAQEAMIDYSRAWSFVRPHKGHGRWRQRTQEYAAVSRCSRCPKPLLRQVRKNTLIQGKANKRKKGLDHYFSALLTVLEGTVWFSEREKCWPAFHSIWRLFTPRGSFTPGTISTAKNNNTSYWFRYR